jgi:hypothetical protein
MPLVAPAPLQKFFPGLKSGDVLAAQGFPPF